MALIARKAEPSSSSYLRGARLSQHNERVEQNLDPWEVALWRRHRYAKTPAGKPLFHGTPDQKARQFKEWLEGHGREAVGERSARAEAKAKTLVRERQSRAMVDVPCASPSRYRTKKACKGERPKGWSKGRAVAVPCGPPSRFRTKELCDPSERRWSPPSEPEAHAFEGLL